MPNRINQENGVALKDTSKVSPGKLWLHSGWQFRAEGSEEWLEARVPGCNFTDLLNNGRIKDPFFGGHEEDLQWIEQKNWEYKCQFILDEEFLNSTGTALVFEGLDTYCEVFLNGQKLLDARNMFLGYKKMCREYLRFGENELMVKFRSPVQEVHDLQQEVGIVYPAENDRSENKLSVFTRKAPYHFGWDWGPRFVTSGIWRPVYLQSMDRAVIDHVHIIQHWVSDTEVRLDAEIQLNATESVNGTLVLHSEQVREKVSAKTTLRTGTNQKTLSITLSDPKRWWPNGLGDPFLYEFTIDLLVEDNCISTVSERVGLRTIEVVNEQDTFGESFYIKVNGHAVFMKGANYIPSDSFLSSVTKSRYRQVFEDVRSANMNMLRVWGGGTYEDDHFYDLADEYGILIWQDFMFSCTLYPGTDEFLENVKNEVTYTLKRLRNHPCLALWCGNNEIEMGIGFWEWQQKFGYSDEQFGRMQQDYHLLFYAILPQLIARYDQGRFYLPSSPIGFWQEKSDDNIGDNHYWGVWHGEEDFDAYRQRVPRFMSEYGFQSFPMQESVDQFIPTDEQHLDSLILKVHQKHPRGNRIISETILRYYRQPTDFKGFLYLSQLVQAEGLKVAFEAHRSSMPFCMGTLYWQLNDCWPVVSWSGIDYFGKWKALHYQARRSFSQYLVLANREEKKVSFYVVSDSLIEHRALLSLTWKDMHGRSLRGTQLDLTLAPCTSQLVLTEDMDQLSQDVFCCVMVLMVDDEIVSKNILYMDNMKNIELPKPAITCKQSEDNGVISLELMSSTFVKNLYVALEGMKGNFSDNFFDLMPHEPLTIHYERQEEEELGELSFLSVYDTCH